MPRLDHVTIQTRDAHEMIGFLETVLGVSKGYRPPIRSDELNGNCRQKRRLEHNR
jgi:hypothetical protein